MNYTHTGPRRRRPQAWARPVTTGHSRLTPGYSQPLYEEPTYTREAPAVDYDRDCGSSYDSGSSDSGSCSYE